MTTTRSYNWLINPTTGDYAIVNGDPVRDETLQFAAYARLKIQRGKWLYAPSPDYGSNLDSIKKRTADVVKRIVAETERALQPLIDERRADSVSVSSVSSARHSEQIAITVVSVEGDQTNFSFSPIGD